MQNNWWLRLDCDTKLNKPTPTGKVTKQISGPTQIWFGNERIHKLTTMHFPFSIEEVTVYAEIVIPDNGTVLAKGCLLYTSPSPRDS